jgi:hypothetical protein
MTEFEKSLWSKYDQAAKKLGPNGVEQEFYIAYQSLVKAGLAQQIKKKYRGVK